MHIQELRRLKQKLEVIEQLHAAPSMYIASAVEVVRRKAFSERYLSKVILAIDLHWKGESTLKIYRLIQVWEFWLTDRV